MEGNITNLAENFFSYINKAFIAQEDYYSVDNQEIITEKKESIEELLSSFPYMGSDLYLEYLKEQYKDDPEQYFRELSKVTRNENEYYPNAHEYPDYFAKLNGRNHPFQMWLDSQPSYIEALRLFRKKRIIGVPDIRYKEKEIPLIPLEVILDYIASCFINRWVDIQKIGIDKYIELSKKQLSKIEKRAGDLLDALDEAFGQLNVDYYVRRSHIAWLKELANRVEGVSRLFVTSHIGMEDRWIRINKKHPKAEREVAIRSICTQYMMYLGKFEFISEKKIKDKSKLVSVDAIRCFQDESYCDHYGVGVWLLRDRPIIHADVIVNVLSVLSVFADDEITERKIQDIASRQRQKMGKNLVRRWLHDGKNKIICYSHHVNKT